MSETDGGRGGCGERNEKIRQISFDLTDTARLFSLVVFELCGLSYNPDDIRFRTGENNRLPYIVLKGERSNSRKVESAIKTWLEITFPERKGLMEADVIDEKERVTLMEKRYHFKGVSISGIDKDIASEIWERIERYEKEHPRRGFIAWFKHGLAQFNR